MLVVGERVDLEEPLVECGRCDRVGWQELLRRAAVDAVSGTDIERARHRERAEHRYPCSCSGCLGPSIPPLDPFMSNSPLKL